MGLFSRLGKMIRGFFGLFVGGLENKNPEVLFEDVKNQIGRARKEAEQQIIDIQTNAELIKMEMTNAEKSLALVKTRIDTAKKQGNKDLLVELLMQEEECQSMYEAHKATYAGAVAEVARIREDYRVFESEMNAKLNELKSLKSQDRMASLRNSINSVNAKYSSKSSCIGSLNDSLERARDIVNRKTAQANAVESLNSGSVDAKLMKLDLNSARERAQARAEALICEDKGFEVKEKIDSKRTG